MRQPSSAYEKCHPRRSRDLERLSDEILLDIFKWLPKKTLLRMATDFGLLKGKHHKEFSSYALPEDSFIYMLHAMADVESENTLIVKSFPSSE